MASELEREAFTKAFSEYGLPEDFSDEPPSDESFTGVLNDTERLFESETFSDVTIKCGRRSWPAHACIIGMQPEYFRAALSGSWAEAQSRVCDLNDQDPDEVHTFLRLLYMSDFRNVKSFTLSELVAQYVMAGRFDAPKVVDSTFNAARRALHFGNTSLETSCGAARILWEGTASSCDKLRMTFIHWYVDAKVATEEPILELIKTVPGFALDFHLASVELARRSKERVRALELDVLDYQRLNWAGPPPLSECPKCGYDENFLGTQKEMKRIRRYYKKFDDLNQAST